MMERIAIVLGVDAEVFLILAVPGITPSRAGVKEIIEKIEGIVKLEEELRRMLHLQEKT
jgi:hypothetical protein